MLRKLKSYLNIKGMAIFVTLAALVALLSVAAVFHARSYFALKNSLVTKGTVELRNIAASGINTGIAILVLDKGVDKQDSLLDLWADQDYLWNTCSLLNFKDGRCMVRIVDLQGKIPINAIVKQGDNDNHLLVAKLLERLIAENLTEFIVDDKDTPQSIVEDIISYIKGDGSRYNYLNDPRELLRVDSVTRLLLFGEREVDRDFNYANLWRKNAALTYDQNYGRRPGLMEFITAFGLKDNPDEIEYGSRININTASREVMLALFPEEDNPLIDTIFRKRQATVNGTANENIDFKREEWFKEEVAALGYPELKLDQELITTSSDWFAIYAIAVSKIGMEKRIRAVVHRELNPAGQIVCKIYSWEETDSVPVSRELADLLKQNAPRPQRNMSLSELKQN